MYPFGGRTRFSILMTKPGLITKGVGGLYTVLTDDGPYACYARGLFRKGKKGRDRTATPLVGDRVTVLIDSEADRTGTVHTLQPRTNELIRPAVANIDRVIVTVAAAQPAFHPGLLDRFLVLAARAGVQAVVCVSKWDLALGDGREAFQPYRMAGYEVVFTSVVRENGLDSLREIMAGKISVFAGPSGVGKSSLINALLPGVGLEVGEISSKLKRGKHTTRAAEILPLGDAPAAGYVVDTPGFSSLETGDIPARDLAGYFQEFVPFLGGCKFNDCLHARHDLHCAVKAQVGTAIHPARYESYLGLL